MNGQTLICPRCHKPVVDFDTPPPAETGTTCNPINTPQCWSFIPLPGQRDLARLDRARRARRGVRRERDGGYGRSAAKEAGKGVRGPGEHGYVCECRLRSCRSRLYMHPSIYDELRHYGTLLSAICARLERRVVLADHGSFVVCATGPKVEL